MADKETPGAARTRKEKALDNASSFELAFRRRNQEPGTISKMLGAVPNPEYGTSLSEGAHAAEIEAGNAAWKQGKSLREMEPEVRKAMREAAATERREARGMKKGGKVKSASERADGCCIRGKTRA